MKFAATFTPGLGDVVVRALKRYSVKELRITRVEDGLIAGETTLPPGVLSEMRFWYNVFVVAVETEVDEAGKLTSYLTKQHLRTLLSTTSDLRTLWVRVLEQGQPARLNPRSQAALLSLLREVGVTPATHRADAELWIVRRASDYGFIGLRLPSPRFKRRKRMAGELRPELVHTLGLLAGVISKDVVLDPFAGHGAIPRELIAGFSPRKVIAFDHDPRLVGSLQVLAKEKPSLEVKVGDALTMKDIPDASVSRVVTDPPWGDYQTLNQPIEEFYRRFIGEMARVLKPGGIGVIVSGAKDALNDAIIAEKSLELIKTYHILVAGKKAVVTKVRKG